MKLLEAGSLPFHKMGKHRRIRFADLAVFKAERDRASAEAMEELAKQAQEFQLGYEDELAVYRGLRCVHVLSHAVAMQRITACA